jgi:cyclopropane-fatty-acyl-phospholipid synthase
LAQRRDETMEETISSVTTEAPRVGASPRAIQSHYDVSNGFYSVWLDPSMTYSCAMWGGESDDLATAQTRKLDHHIERARLAGTARVLDIGCGWGSALRRLTSVHGVGKAVGLTLSDAQASFIRKAPDPKIEVRVESWQTHSPQSPYDGVLCIGALEHFARPDQAPSARIDAYQQFFLRARELLKPERYLSLQTVSFGTGRFIPGTPLADIFPESHLPTLAELATAYDRIFELEIVRNDREDYVRTLNAWLRSLEANWDQAVAATDEALVERYQRYLQFSVMGFSSGAFELLRLALRARPVRTARK